MLHIVVKKGGGVLSWKGVVDFGSVGVNRGVYSRREG